MPIALEIVSPDRLLLSQPVDMVVMPAAEGDMGVLPGHAPMIVLLQGGTITLHEGGRATSKLYVSGGFAEITPERCTVLADEAVPTGEVWAWNQAMLDLGATVCRARRPDCGSCPVAERCAWARACSAPTWPSTTTRWTGAWPDRSIPSAPTPWYEWCAWWTRRPGF